MKILLYNYVQPDEYNSPGGGVTVYLRNLISALRDQCHEVFVLSSGDRYDVLPSKPRIEQRGKYRLILYNSPVLAPAIFSFEHPEIFNSDQSLNSMPKTIKNLVGTFDIIHFHNIEGLTLGFFNAIKQHNPASRILFSAHNYTTVCPQVNLWQHGLHACNDYNNGYACIGCANYQYNYRRKIVINKLKTLAKNIADYHPSLAQRFRVLDGYAMQWMKGRDKPAQRAARPTSQRMGGDAEARDRIAREYRNYRANGLTLINEVFDRTLCVSERTKAVLRMLGATEERLLTCYIGTKHADPKNITVPKKGRYTAGKTYHIAYLGYMRRDKGFFYFLDSLCNLQASTSRNLDITIAARFTDDEALHTIDGIRGKFHGIRMLNGFSQGTLGDTLAPVDLGIVPSLWEDNLPQIALEFVSYGVPVLTSNRGGAQEICGNNAFVFDIEDPLGLVAKIEDVVHGKLDMGEFWIHNKKLITNSQHVTQMCNIYESIMALNQP